MDIPSQRSHSRPSWVKWEDMACRSKVNRTRTHEERTVTIAAGLEVALRHEQSQHRTSTNHRPLLMNETRRASHTQDIRARLLWPRCYWLVIERSRLRNSASAK